MKKLYTLLAALMMVMGATAQSIIPEGQEFKSLGDQVTSLDGIEDGGFYVLKCNNQRFFYQNSNDNKLYYTTDTPSNDTFVFKINVSATSNNTKTATIQACNGNYLQMPRNQITTTANAADATTLTINLQGSNYFFIKNGGTSIMNANASWPQGADPGWTGQWSQIQIYKANLGQVKQKVTVHWTIKGTNGQQLTTYDQQVEINTDNVSCNAPYAFTTFTGTVNVGTEDVNAEATATFNAPYESYASFDAVQKWYYVRNGNADGTTNNNHDYLFYNPQQSNVIKAQTAKTVDDNFLWGFIGNPIDGYQVVNKGAGSGKYVTAASTSVQPHLADSEQQSSWKIWEGKVENNIRYFSFSLATTTRATDKSFWNWQGNEVKWWQLKNDQNVFDNGSCWCVEEAIADYTALSSALAKAKTYQGLIGSGLGHYAEAASGTLSSAITTAQAIVDAQSEHQDVSYQTSINSATEILNTAISGLTLNMPATGTYLRVKGDISQGYLTSPAAGQTTDLTTNTDNADTNTSIWYYGTDGLLSYYSGEYVGTQKALSTSTNAVTIQANTNFPGTYALGTTGATNSGELRYLHSGTANSSIDRGNGTVSTLTDQGYAWNLEEVGSLPVTLNTSGENAYGSLYLPKAVSVPENVDVYMLTSADAGNGTATLTKIDNTIAAEEPVVLVGTAASGEASTTINVTVAEKTDKNEGNLLAGTYVAQQTNTADYYLGQLSGNAGFYRTTLTKYVVNKAYYHSESSSAAKGFAFSFDTVTGINKVGSNAAAKADAPRYNLAGQRVSKSYKGVVIVGGKKVLQ